MVSPQFQLHLSRLVILLILLGFFHQTQAQDTMYYQIQPPYHTWYITTKEKADYYRPGPLRKEGDLYRVEDYYINGNLQMSGLSSCKDGCDYEGTVIFYYQDGAIEQTIQYENGEKNGPTIYYYPDGTIKTSGIYKDNKQWSGTFNRDKYDYGSNIDLGPLEILEYENNQEIGGMTTYLNSRQIAQRASIDLKNNIINWIYYYRSGEKMGEYNYSRDSNSREGVKIDFYELDNQAINIYRIQVFKKDNEVAINKKKEEVENPDFIKNKILEKDTFFNGTIKYGYELRTYKKGALNGPDIFYNINQEEIAKGIYKNNKPWEGQFIEDLRDAEIFSYRNGELAGKQSTYFDKDTLKRIASYHHLENGKKEGAAAKFNKDGTLLTKGIYREDLPLEGSFWENVGWGYDYKIENYKDGKLNGLVTVYNSQGAFLKEVEYKDGNPTGWETVYSKITGKKHRVLLKMVDGHSRPFEGEIFRNDELSTYQAGHLLEEVTYDYDTKKPTLFKKYGIRSNADKNQRRETEQMEQVSFYDGVEYKLTFKNNLPYSGIYRDDYEEITYKNRKKSGRYVYFGIHGTHSMTANYKEDWIQGKVTFINASTKDITHCIYRDSLPFEGVNIVDDERFTYKNGKKNGLATLPIIRYNDSEFAIKGVKKTMVYVDDLLDGPIIYYDENGKIIEEAMYKNDLPYDGNFYDFHLVGRTTFLKGKLVRDIYLNNNYVFDLQYDSEVLKPFEFAIEDYELLQGLYKNDQPFEGVFLEEIEKPAHSNRTEITAILTSYKHGKKDGFEKYFGGRQNKLVRQKNYENGVLVAVTEFEPNFKDQEEWTLTYRDGLPYAGQQITHQDYLLRISSFEGGKQSGDEYYLNPRNELIQQKNYKNGELVTVTEFRPNFSGQKEWILKYQNGVPYAGQQINEQNRIFCISTYEAGKHSGYDYYLDAYEEGLLIDSLYFENGRPTHGAHLEYADERYHKHLYENGQIVETRMYNHLSHHNVTGYDQNGEQIPVLSSAVTNDKPTAIIKYTQNGFKVKFTTLSDSRAGKMVLTIDDETTNSGTITYSKYSLSLGYLKFSQGKIIALDAKEILPDFLIDKKGDLYFTRDRGNLIHHIYPNYQLSSPPSYQNLLDGYSIFFKKQTAYTFVKGEDTPICSMELRDSEFHEGVFIESDSNNNFNYSIFKDGERIVKIRDISLEEVREKVKELQE